METCKRDKVTPISSACCTEGPLWHVNAVSAIHLVLWQAVQMGLLKLQKAYGARCFVPNCLIPRPYDYQRDVGHIVRAAQGEEGCECAICMGSVDPVTGAYMVTPCDHLFHEICLAQWMDLKMECPVCRAALPPRTSDDDDQQGSPPDP